MLEREEESRLVVYGAFALTVLESAHILLDSGLGRLDLECTEAHLQRWARRLFRLGRLSLEVHGLSRVPRDQPFVIMSNHASLLDVPSILRSFPGPVRMVSKKELAKIPVFGQAMKAAGTIIVDRENREQAIRALDGADDFAKKGISVWIAPEGTRSKTGQLGGFKKGGFHVAKNLGLPILPVWVDGTRDILETKKLVAHPGKMIRVFYGAPIDVDSGKSIDALMAEVRPALLGLAAEAGASDVDALAH